MTKNGAEVQAERERRITERYERRMRFTMTARAKNLICGAVFWPGFVAAIIGVVAKDEGRCGPGIFLVGFAAASLGACLWLFVFNRIGEHCPDCGHKPLDYWCSPMGTFDGHKCPNCKWAD